MPGAGKARPNLNPNPEKPVRLPLMFQGWKWLTFLHWPYSPETIQRLLPGGLRVDTYDGKAWVGLTPFVVKLRPPVPASLLEYTFPETNVRTYVVGPDGNTGVWFFSLDAGMFSAVVGARTLYALPYKWSRMTVDVGHGTVRYQSRRKWPDPGPSLEISLSTGDPFAAEELGPLDHFLTARWRLYSDARWSLMTAQIEHPPWPLHHARVEKLEEGLVAAAGLPRPEGEPLVHYSPGVDVRIGWPRTV